MYARSQLLLKFVQLKYCHLKIILGVITIGLPISSYVLQLLRNFNSTDHGSNLQHIKHQAKTNLIELLLTNCIYTYFCRLKIFNIAYMQT